MYYIYEIYNDVTQKRYIGLSARPTRRFQRHLTQLRNHTHTAEGINKDFILFGEKHFFFRVIDTANTKEKGLSKERRYILNTRSYVSDYGYNGNDPRWNRKVPIKAIMDSELKRAIEAKRYRVTEMPWVLNMRYSEFVTKMNHQEMFTDEEIGILQDIIQNSPTDWYERHRFMWNIREKRKG